MARVVPSPWFKKPEKAPGSTEVPTGTRVYAVGDIHGCVPQLTALHRMILQDAEAGPARRVVVYLGDYIDRGADPREAVDILVEEPLPGFETVHLIGNHEAFLLKFLEDEGVITSWLMNGGEATCRSYGVDPYAPQIAEWRPPSLREQLAERIPESHLSFYRGLRISHTEGGYHFVHAGIRPGVDLDHQDPNDLMWIREPFLSSPKDHGKVVVHGHTPSPEPVVQANRIGIDTGACYGGPLTALVLERESRRFLQA